MHCSVADGVYLCQCQIADYPVLYGVGTVMVDRGLFEAFVFDLDDDVYGEDVEVFLLARLRDNRKFSCDDALCEQLAKDVERGKAMMKDMLG